MEFKFNFKFDDSGFKKLQQNLDNLPKESEVAFSELFIDDFMKQYTDFQTFQAMFDASGVKDLEQIESEEFSKFVSAHSKFENWEDMKGKAGTEYVARKLGF